jgi:hypothetical protein
VTRAAVSPGYLVAGHHCPPQTSDEDPIRIRALPTEDGPWWPAATKARRPAAHQVRARTALHGDTGFLLEGELFVLGRMGDSTNHGRHAARTTLLNWRQEVP